MRVLIVTYYWPPAGGSGVQRWLKFAKYLPEYDMTPVIFTADGADYPVLDLSHEQEVSGELEVIRSKIWEPNMLLGRGKKKESSGFLDPNPGLLGKALQYVRANFFVPDARKYWIKPSVKKLKSYLKRNPVDLVITTGPPHSVHLIGFELKKQTGIRWISDFRDPWTNIDYFHQLPMTLRTKRKHYELEQRVLKSSDAVVVVGKSMQDEFSSHGSKVRVITNGYDTEAHIPGQVEKDKQFTLVHLGMMNADRNPKVLWRVLKDMLSEHKEMHDQFKVKLIGKTSKEVKQSVVEYNLESSVEYVPYLEHKLVQKEQDKAWALLLSVNKVPSAPSIVTGKVFEYLQTGNPILAIGPIDGDLDKLLEQAGAGRVIDFEDEIGLKKRILDLYRGFKEGKDLKEERNVEKYHRRNLAGELAELIREVTKA